MSYTKYQLHKGETLMNNLVGRVFDSFGIFKNVRNGNIIVSKEGYDTSACYDVHLEEKIGKHALTAYARFYLDQDLAFVRVVFNRYDDNAVGDKEERKIKLSTLLQKDYMQNAILSAIKKGRLDFQPHRDSDYSAINLADFFNRMCDKRGYARLQINNYGYNGISQLLMSIGGSDGRTKAQGKIELNNNQYRIHSLGTFPRGKSQQLNQLGSFTTPSAPIDAVLKLYADEVMDKNPSLYA